MGKIFGIGLSRTGSLTLAQSLSILGYESIHFPQSFEEIERYDACTDSPIAAWYKELDYKYPNSKFILTIREPDSWLDSVEELWRKNGKDFKGFADEIHIRLYGGTDFNRIRFLNNYTRHYSNAMTYFFHRPEDCLIMNICEGDGWEKLCPFLEKEIPDKEFPHANSRDFLGKYEWVREYK